jgi:hypothetical protein
MEGRRVRFLEREPSPEITDRMHPVIDAWAAPLPDSLTEGAPPRRIEVVR